MVSGEPDLDIAKNSNDQYGQPEFISAPTLTNPNSYKLKSSSPTYQAGIGPFQDGFSNVIGASSTLISPSPSPTVDPSPSTSPTTCSEDINLDRIVNILDYTIMAGDFFDTDLKKS